MDSPLSTFLLKNAKLVHESKGYSSEEVNLLIRLWIHFSKYAEVYHLSLANVQSIFDFYDSIKALVSESEGCAELPSFSTHSLETYTLYSSLCRAALKAVLDDFKEPYTSSEEADAVDEPSLRVTVALATKLFQNVYISSTCVTQNDWFPIAEMVFWTYIENPGFLCPSSFLDQMKEAFEKAHSVPLWQWSPQTWVMVLLTLCEMAEDSTLLLRLLEERVTQRRVVVREKKESDVSEKKEKKESDVSEKREKKESDVSEKKEKKEVSEKEKEEVKENEESESEKEAEAFTEEQKTYLDALVKAIEAKIVEEVRVRVRASFDE